MTFSLGIRHGFASRASILESPVGLSIHRDAADRSYASGAAGAGLQRSSENRLGPFRDRSQIARIGDLPGKHMQEKGRFRARTRIRVRFAAVVVYEQFGQPRQEADQLEPAAIV